MKKRVLIVDDEETLCEALRINLEAEGFETGVAYSAEEALALDLTQFDIILLDIMMSDISGLQFAKIVRTSARTAKLPIIFCTARDTEDDMVAALNLGGDDYITKPYSIRNVIARVRSVLRRTDSSSQGRATEITGFGSLEIDHERKSCSLDGTELKMPRKEFEILRTLASSPGRIFTREELIGKIWPDEVVVLDRVVDVNITRLRRKLGSYGKHIVTRPGYGYGFFE